MMEIESFMSEKFYIGLIEGLKKDKLENVCIINEKDVYLKGVYNQNTYNDSFSE